MPNSSLSYPKVRIDKSGKYFIDLTLNDKRYRVYSGKIIKSSLRPNSYPAKYRLSKAKILADEVYKHLVSNDYCFGKKLTKVETFDSLVNNKLSEPLSNSYRKTLILLSNRLRSELVYKGSISKEFINSIPLNYNNNTSYNTTRRHLNVLVNYLCDNGFDIERSKLKTRKQEEVLHKPINDIPSLLDEVALFNKNLHLCCLFTYCCLLRPHQEIRLLKWSDFNDDLSYLSLSGSRVKSKRNRQVPVPLVIRKLLVRNEPNINIFSGKETPYNNDYFKTLFRRFKGLNNHIDNGVTLYSFRHSGAIEIYKRTGSLSKLQTAMGHSSLNVSLTYLRGLEIAELKEEDMPMV